MRQTSDAYHERTTEKVSDPGRTRRYPLAASARRITRTPTPRQVHRVQAAASRSQPTSEARRQTMS